MWDIQYLLMWIMDIIVAYIFLRCDKRYVNKILFRFFLAQSFDYITYYFAVINHLSTDHWIMNLTSIPQYITMFILFWYLIKYKYILKK